jgi:hypothetical protein
MNGYLKGKIEGIGSNNSYVRDARDFLFNEQTIIGENHKEEIINLID